METLLKFCFCFPNYTKSRKGTAWFMIFHNIWSSHLIILKIHKVKHWRPTPCG
jgi:hypothetical protein